MSKYTKLSPSILPYRNNKNKKLPLPYNRNKSIIKKTRLRLPLIPPPIEIPILSDNKTPISWKEIQLKENKRISEQQKAIVEFQRLFEILKTKTNKFNHSYFESIQFLYVQAPAIIMRILNECVSDTSDDIKIKIIELIIAKTFRLYVFKITEYEEYTKYIKSIEDTIDTETIECINEKITSYNILKNPNWSQMKTKKSAKKSVKSAKKSAKKSLKKSKKSVKKVQRKV